MKMTRKKGEKGEFTRRLIQYAIESGVLARCPDHAGSIYRTGQDVGLAHALVQSAWEIGEISSGLEGVIARLNALLDKAPRKCSQIKCWRNDP